MNSLCDFLAKVFDSVLIIQVISYKKKLTFHKMNRDRSKMIKIFSILFLCLIGSMTSLAGQPNLVPHQINLKNGKRFSLNFPANYEIIPAAEGLKRVRFFSKAPDSRMFVTDMHDLTDNKNGIVYILDEWNAETGKFGKIIPYMTGLKNPNSVQFYTDSSGQDWLYLAETHQLTRQKFTRGEIKPTGKAEVLATFPDYGLSYKYGSRKKKLEQLF